MAAVKISKETLTEVADAARKKTGRGAPLTPRGIADEVGMIPSCGKDGRDAEWISRTLRTAFIPEGIKEISPYFFEGCKELSLTEIPDSITRIGESAFGSCQKLALTKLPDNVEEITRRAFHGCQELLIKTIPRSVKKMECDSICTFTSPRMTEITFEGKPDVLQGYIFGCPNLTVINVPWAEGEVKGAPWGATKATINYNFKEGNDGKGDAL